MGWTTWDGSDDFGLGGGPRPTEEQRSSAAATSAVTRVGTGAADRDLTQRRSRLLGYSAPA